MFLLKSEELELISVPLRLLSDCESNILRTLLDYLKGSDALPNGEVGVDLASQSLAL